MKVDSPAQRDFFVSFNKSDREWAAWIAWELEEAGYSVIFQDWDFRGNFVDQMDRSQRETKRTIAIISDHYFASGFTIPEWTARFAQDPAGRNDFLIPVKVGSVKNLGILEPTIYADITGCDESRARNVLLERVRKAVDPEYRAKPKDRPIFPGASIEVPSRQIINKPTFPALVEAISNVPVFIPILFMGRDGALKALGEALQRQSGRAAITALFGMRGIGKTTLAAAYSKLKSTSYRVTWWVRGQTNSTLRADMIGLGVRLGWVGESEMEASALATTLEMLRTDGEGILVIFDNAIDARALRPYLPRGGTSHIIVTSNAPDWSGIAEPIELALWPKEIGAEYLIRRIGRNAERVAAEDLSLALGGLPLAHEQAGAYCNRLGISIETYLIRFNASPVDLMEKDPSIEYHADDHPDGLTVAKTFALAIEEASRLHPAAELLIAYAAVLAPEPIPLFLFEEGRKLMGEPFASALANDRLDGAVAALRAFALVENKSIQDERDPAIITDCLQLHRLVRQIALARQNRDAQLEMRRALIAALFKIFPNVNAGLQTWPRARRLDALVLDLVDDDSELQNDVEASAAELLHRLAVYRRVALGAYAAARPLFERALAIREKVLEPEHNDINQTLNSLAVLLNTQGDYSAARPLLERALIIQEKVHGPDHNSTVACLNNLACALRHQDDLDGSKSIFERVLAIRERVHGIRHPITARTINNLAVVLEAQGDIKGARERYEHALAIREESLRPDDPEIAISLYSFAAFLTSQGDHGLARPLLVKALSIYEKVFGLDHPNAVLTLNKLADLGGCEEY